MTQEEILQYNKRCAEFLGLEILKDEYCYDYPDFHSDWNWIMEVVEAIEKLGDTSAMYGTLVDITTTYIAIGEIATDLKLVPMTKKEAVVEAINQFLIWYESQT